MDKNQKTNSKATNQPNDRTEFGNEISDMNNSDKASSKKTGKK